MKKKIVFIIISFIFVGVIGGLFVYNGVKAKASNEQDTKEENLPKVTFVNYKGYGKIKEDWVYPGKLRNWVLNASDGCGIIYEVDGKQQVDFEGIVDCEGEAYYIKNGDHQKEFSGLVKDDNKGIYCFEDGYLCKVTTIEEYEGEEYLFIGGRSLFGEKSVNGIVEFSKKYYLVKNSKIIKRYGRNLELNEGEYEGDEIIIYII